MPGDVREQNPANPAGGAARRIVNIAAPLCLPERFAVDPGVQAAQLNFAGRELASAPNFHARHLLRRLVAHRTIILGEFGK